MTEARIPRGTLSAILELHIEQGPQLYQTKVQIGVVQGIVGLKLTLIRVQHQAAGIDFAVAAGLGDQIGGDVGRVAVRYSPPDDAAAPNIPAEAWEDHP